jgi:hypothetical protein
MSYPIHVRAWDNSLATASCAREEPRTFPRSNDASANVSFDKVSQFRQLVEKFLQVAIGDFVRDARYQGFCLIRVVAAETPCKREVLDGSLEQQEPSIKCCT